MVVRAFRPHLVTCLLPLLLGFALAESTLAQPNILADPFAGPGADPFAGPGADPFGGPPRVSADPIYDLRGLALAKFDSDGAENGRGPAIVLMIEQYRFESKSQKVMLAVPEQRTRTVQVRDPNGDTREVTQTYTVMVRQQVEREVAVPVAAGKKPTSLPLDQTRVFDLEGKPLGQEQVSQQLAQVKPVFVMQIPESDSLDQVQVAPASDLVRRAMNPECLVIAIKRLHSEGAKPKPVPGRDPFAP